MTPFQNLAERWMTSQLREIPKVAANRRALRRAIAAEIWVVSDPAPDAAPGAMVASPQRSLESHMKPLRNIAAKIGPGHSVATLSDDVARDGRASVSAATGMRRFARPAAMKGAA